MRRFLGMALWMIACCVCLAPAVAFWQSRDSGYNVSVGGAPPAYTGPGDVVSGASAWWGLRAYSSATRGGKAINVCNVGDAACVDFLTDATTGNLVITTVGGSSCSVITCTIKTLYDQTGALSCSGAACDLTGGTRPTLTVSCQAGLPCMAYASGAGFAKAATNFSLTQPFSLSAVFNSTAVTGTVLISGQNPSAVLGIFVTATQVQLTAGTAFNVTETPNNWYATQGIANGASSTLFINGTTNSGNAGAGNWASANPINTGIDGFGDNYVGKIVELGAWAGGFNGTQQANMNANQRAYWGF